MIQSLSTSEECTVLSDQICYNKKMWAKKRAGVLVAKFD